MLVLSSKHVKGYDGPGQAIPPGPVARVGIQPGLLARYDTDAHCVQYDVVGVDPVRVNKGGLAALRARGGDVRMVALFVDVDAPDHGADADPDDVAEWRNWQAIARSALPWAACYYQTRGGYRLVWRYAEPVDPTTHERTARAMLDALGRYGIQGDKACVDWTRLMRLPRATRDGVALDLPHTIRRGVPTVPALDLAPYEATTADPVDLGDVAGVDGLPELFEARGLVKAVRPGRIDVECPWCEYHGSTSGPSATSLLQLPGGGWAFSCLHNHSGLPVDQQGPKRTADVRALWPEAWGQHCQDAAPVVDVVTRGDRRTLADIRADLPGVLADALDTGAAVVRAPTGAGKTQAVIRLALDRAALGQVVVIATPSRDTREEIHRRVMSARADFDGFDAPDVVVLRGREPETCEAYDQIEPLFRAGGPEAVKTFCGGCPFRDGCGFYGQFTRERYRAAGRVVLATHHFVFQSGTPLDQRIDALIVDEDPTGVIAGEVLATAAHIDRAIGEGALIVDDATRGGWGRLMGTTGAGSDALASVDGDVIAGPPGALPEAAYRADRETLDSRPDWRLPDALVSAARTGWRGAYVQGGTLCVPAPRLRWPKAAARLVLDASADEVGAAYVLPGSTFFDLGVPVEVDHVTVTRYDVNAGRSDVERRPEYAYAIHRAYDGPGTVHVTHKAFTDAPDRLGRWDWITPARGRVDYFGSARQSATNTYADADTIVLDSFHVPRRAVASLVERMAPALPGVDADELAEVARRRMVWRAIDQWLGRLRSVNREGTPLRVVLIDRRPHWSSVLPDTETIGALGARVWEQCRALVNRPGSLVAYWVERLAREGAAWLDEDTRRDDVTTEDRPTLRQSAPLYLLRKHYRGRFSEFADDVAHQLGRGVRVGSVRFVRGTSARRRWFIHVEGSPVYGELVHRAALVDRVDWIEYDDGRHAGPSNRYWQAAQDAAFNLLDGEALTVDAVARHAGRTPRQVRRVLRLLDKTAEDLATDGPELFRPVCPPDAECSALTGRVVRHVAFTPPPVSGWVTNILARGPPSPVVTLDD